MKSVTIEIEEATAALLEAMPPATRQLITNNALNALLKGELYPTGTEQLELAIDLAEAGVNPIIISKLTRLEPEAFDGFIKRK